MTNKFPTCEDCVYFYENSFGCECTKVHLKTYPNHACFHLKERKSRRVDNDTERTIG